MANTNGDAPRELFLIDGNSLAYRAFFALPEEISTSDGRPTNAIFGFASMLVKILADYGQVPTVVVWDAGMSGRKEISADYKAQRSTRPDLLKLQWPHLRPLVEAFGYHNISVEGFEADDVIATLVEQARERGIPVMVVTGDRDAYQLVDDGVRIMTTSRGITDTRVYDREGVVDRYGIAPELIPDFIGLKGDTSDNIPGVPGIGDKTAAQLLQEFGSLEEVLAHVEDISGAKRKQNLLEHADDARISKQLATAQRDLDVDVDVAAEASREPDRSRLREVFRQFELRDPLRRLEEALGSAEEAAPVEPPTGDGALTANVREGTPQDIARLRGKELVLAVRRPAVPQGALFAEGTPWRFAAHAGGASVLVGDADGPEPVVAAAGDRPVVVHDAKALGHVPDNLEHDTMIAAYLLDPAARAYPLAELAAARGLGAAVDDPTARDALLTGALAAWQRKQLTERGHDSLLKEIELPLVRALREMELAGCRLDTDRLGRSRAPHLPPGGDRHRTAVLDRSQPPEHPRADRPGAGDPGVFRGRAGQRAPVRRLLAGRAAHPRPGGRRARAQGDLPARGGRAHGDVDGRVRRRGRRDRPGDALEVQDDQLRDRLRPLGLRHCRSPPDTPGGGAGGHRHLPRALPAGEGVHGAHDRAGHRGRLRHHAIRPPPPCARTARA